VNNIIVHWGDGDTDQFATTGDVTHIYDDVFMHTITCTAPLGLSQHPRSGWFGAALNWDRAIVLVCWQAGDPM